VLILEKTQPERSGKRKETGKKQWQEEVNDARKKPRTTTKSFGACALNM